MKLVDPTSTLDLAFKHPRCPYCHEDVRPDDADKRPCLECMAWHHDACLTAHRRCAACDEPEKPTQRPRRRKRAGKQARSAPKRSVPLAEAVLPTRRQVLAQLLVVPCVALTVFVLALKRTAGLNLSLGFGTLLTGGGLLLLVVGVAWFARDRTRPVVAPARPASATPRRQGGTSGRTVRPRTSPARAVAGFCFGTLVGWYGVQLIAQAIGITLLSTEPELYLEFLHRPATEALFAFLALLLGGVVAALIYRD